MHWKTSPEGILATIALGLYVLAPLLWWRRKARLAWLGYGLGGALLLTALLWRAQTLAGWPLRDLFEIFLALALLSCPVALGARYCLRIGAPWMDMILGALFLFPAAFVFSDTPRDLPPILRTWIFAPHVLCYLLGYVLILKASLCACRGRKTMDATPTDTPYCGLRASRRLALLAFPFLTVGLALGAYWGQLAWGSWWNYDPKEMLALSGWVLLFAILFIEESFPEGYRAVKRGLYLAMGLLVILTLVIANVTRIFGGLHSYAQ